MGEERRKGKGKRSPQKKKRRHSPTSDEAKRSKEREDHGRRSQKLLETSDEDREWSRNGMEMSTKLEKKSKLKSDKKHKSKKDDERGMSSGRGNARGKAIDRVQEDRRSKRCSSSSTERVEKEKKGSENVSKGKHQKMHM